MSRLVLWVSIIGCAMLQAILPAWMALGQAKPPLLLGAVLYYALSRDNLQVLEASILAGILQDSLGPIKLGFSVVAFVTVALLVNHYRERVFADHWFTHVMIGIGSSVLVCFILYVLLVAGDLRAGVQFPFVLSKALGMSLLGVVTFPLVYTFIDHLDLWMGVTKRREL